jgi:hypothetical protein
MEHFLLLLILKHAFADLLIQSIRPPADKTKYVGKGLLHSLDHAVGTFVVTILYFQDIKLALLLAIIDGIVHHHIDYFKSCFVKKAGWKRDEPRFWKLQAFDQMAHYLTYYGLLFLC